MTARTSDAAATGAGSRARIVFGASAIGVDEVVALAEGRVGAALSGDPRWLARLEAGRALLHEQAEDGQAGVLRERSEGGDGVIRFHVSNSIEMLEHVSSENFSQIRNKARRSQAAAGTADLSGTWLIAYSAIAVIVRLGFTPGLAGTTDPSHTIRLR